MGIRSTKTTLYTGTGNVDQVLAPNPHRVGLFVSVVLTTTVVRWALGQVDSSDQMQYATQIGACPARLTREEIGDTIQYTLFAFAAAGVVVLFTEVIES